jgi:chemotaxis protein CheD
MNTGTLITVGISDCAVSNDPSAVLVTHALGSCIALAIHDPVAQVAGLLHFMLPDSGLQRDQHNSRPFMYADTGIPLLFHGAYGLGAAKPRLIVTALGGAQVIEASDAFNIGKRNYLAMRRILWKAGVMLHAEDVGGNLPRTAHMEVGSGRIIVSSDRQERVIQRTHTERSRAV